MSYTATVDRYVRYSNIGQLCQIQQYWTAELDTATSDSCVRYSNIGQLADTAILDSCVRHSNIGQLCARYSDVRQL